MAALVDQVRDWPVYGLTFTFYVPTKNDRSRHAWPTNQDRDPVVARVLELKRRHPDFIKNTVESLELMHSSLCRQVTDSCLLQETLLPLYMGEGGRFVQPECCYGNDADCDRCGAWAVFHIAAARGAPSDAADLTPGEWYDATTDPSEPRQKSRPSS